MKNKQRKELIAKILATPEGRDQFISTYLNTYATCYKYEKQIDAISTKIPQLEKELLQLRSSFMTFLGTYEYVQSLNEKEGKEKAEKSSTEAANSTAGGIEKRILGTTRDFYINGEEFNLSKEEQNEMYNNYEAYLHDEATCEYMLGLYENLAAYEKGLIALCKKSEFRLDDLFNCYNAVHTHTRGIIKAEDMDAVKVYASRAIEEINKVNGIKMPYISYYFGNYETKTKTPEHDVTNEQF